ncbi:hypothetical protein ACFWPH_09985 [Nocardia sp. NPDC058499]|uniref:hypothetical protein n=1 Tax=Nocardia sp. NPDC058499 TaxID=3346530 RepID=UPI0036654A7B
MSEAIDPSTRLATPEVEEWWSTGGKLVDMALGNAYSVSYYLSIISHFRERNQNGWLR